MKERSDHIAGLAGDSLHVMVKEAGWPSSSDSLSHRWWANESCQCRFFSQLDTLRDTTQFRFCHFEAFDGFWKNWGPEEPYWGVFDSHRSPKLYARSLQPVEERDRRGEVRFPRSQPTVGLGPVLLAELGTAAVYDLSGQRVADPRGLPDGVYFVCERSVAVSTEPSAISARKVIVTR